MKDDISDEHFYPERFERTTITVSVRCGFKDDNDEMVAVGISTAHCKEPVARDLLSWMIYFEHYSGGLDFGQYKQQEKTDNENQRD